LFPSSLLFAVHEVLRRPREMAEVALVPRITPEVPKEATEELRGGRRKKGCINLY
jgi:hypothetical protein